MNALAMKVAHRLLPKSLFGSPLPDPEPINGRPREVTGLFGALSEKQRASALRYRGEENHGDRAYLQR